MRPLNFAINSLNSHSHKSGNDRKGAFFKGLVVSEHIDLANRLTDNLPLGIKFRSGNGPFGPVWWKIARRQMQRAGRRRQATGNTNSSKFCALRSLFLAPGLKIRDFSNDPLYLLIMPRATNKRRISNMKTGG